MLNVKSLAFLPGHFHLLSRAFESAVKSLSRSESTPSIKACLADKVLAAAASGEIDPNRLTDASLAAVRECLRNCTGCQQEGRRLDLNEGSSPLA